MITSLSLFATPKQWKVNQAIQQLNNFNVGLQDTFPLNLIPAILHYKKLTHSPCNGTLNHN